MNYINFTSLKSEVQDWLDNQGIKAIAYGLGRGCHGVEILFIGDKSDDETSDTFLKKYDKLETGFHKGYFTRICSFKIYVSMIKK